MWETRIKERQESPTLSQGRPSPLQEKGFTTSFLTRSSSASSSPIFPDKDDLIPTLDEIKQKLKLDEYSLN